MNTRPTRRRAPACSSATTISRFVRRLVDAGSSSSGSPPREEIVMMRSLPPVGASRRHRGELSAGAVDLATAGVAHGDGNAAPLEGAHERALVLGARRGPLRPGVGLSGIRLTCTRWPTSRSASRSARHAWSLMSLMSAYSMLTRRCVASRVLPRRIEHLGDLPARVHRHEGVAQLVVGACRDTASVTGMPSVGQLADAGHQADRRHGDAARAHAEARRCRLDEPAHGTHDRLVVGERLPHAHEHDVGDPARAARDLAACERPRPRRAPARRSRRSTGCG